MLDEEEYASSTDESDDDYKPDGNDSEAGSEVDTDDETADNDTDAKDNNRKRKQTSLQADAKKTKLQPTNGSGKSLGSAKNESVTTLSDDDEDSNEDELWASFLSKAETPATQVTMAKQPQQQPAATKISTTGTSKNVALPASKGASNNIKPVADKPKMVTQIFEFAGEKIEIQKEVKADNGAALNAADSNAAKKKSAAPQMRGRTSGLSAALDQLTKPNKLSMLQKTHLDWSGFKKNEGIDEELQTHNKGRDGFLERQDFLQRTDVRQFEIEKNMRQTSRRKWIDWRWISIFSYFASLSEIVRLNLATSLIHLQ